MEEDGLERGWHHLGLGRINQALFVVCGGKAPPATSGIEEFGNNDPAENFEKRDVQHAVRAENSEGVEGLGAK